MWSEDSERKANMSPEDKEGTAESRFRRAFVRLKSNKPKVLHEGAIVSQNNVAKEAGCDPSALKKSRFPSLVREIQAFVEINSTDRPQSKRQATLKIRDSRKEHKDRLDEVARQRDYAQSQLASAHKRIVEQAEEIKFLRMKLDELVPPVVILNR